MIRYVTPEKFQEMTRLLDIAKERDDLAKTNLPLCAKLALKREANELREKAMSL